MLISLGARASDATPQRIETTWPDFVTWLYQCSRIQAGISPAEYAHLKTFPSKSPEGRRIHDDKDGPYAVLADFGGGRREYASLLHSSGVPLDFDAGWITQDIIQATLAGTAYLAFTTYAHQPGAERWRVFVPAARPMTADEHTAAWFHLSGLFNGSADPAAKDATRLSYLPGRTLLPDAARIFHADGAFFQPIPVAPAAPSVLQTDGGGPVPGWAGPIDDVELLTIACNTRTRPDERFGAPIHFAQLWAANPEWLGQRFPSAAQPWDYTQADMALAGELIYWTGRDTERSLDLLRQSGLAAVRGGDTDWHDRKAPLAVERAAANAKQYHFMKGGAESTQPAQATGDALVNVAGFTISLNVNDVPAGTDAPTAPPAPSVVDTAVAATLANIPAGASVTLNDFFAFLPDHTYIHRQSGVAISAASVDEAIGKEARQVLVPTVPVHSYTWAPGYPERFTLDAMDPTHVGGESVWLYNQYRAPRAPQAGGDVSQWLDLLRRLYPDDADHIVNYFADAVQHPGRKCNHALVLGSGVHGTGKDTLLAPLQYAVGDKNFRVIKPYQLAETFTPWMRSVVVQVSESRDMGEGFASISRYEMYERCKDLAAAPPKSLDCNEKFKGQYPVANVMRLVITTNHQTDGLHMDPNDRRHYCAWSDAEKMTEPDAMAIYRWYENGGLEAVAHYLRTLDLNARGFNRTAPPLRTGWWHQLVAGGASNEEDRFSDALDKLGRPDWVTLAHVAEAGGLELAGWIAAPQNRRKMEREMVKGGYQRLPNPHDKRGRWSFNAVQTVIYRRSDVPAKILVAKFGA